MIEMAASLSPRVAALSVLYPAHEARLGRPFHLPQPENSHPQTTLESCRAIFLLYAWPSEAGIAPYLASERHLPGLGLVAQTATIRLYGQIRAS